MKKRNTVTIKLQTSVDGLTRVYLNKVSLLNPLRVLEHPYLVFRERFAFRSRFVITDKHF